MRGCGELAPSLDDAVNETSQFVAFTSQAEQHVVFLAAVDLQIFLNKALFNEAILSQHAARCHIPGQKGGVNAVQIERIKDKWQAAMASVMRLLPANC